MGALTIVEKVLGIIENLTELPEQKELLELVKILDATLQNRDQYIINMEKDYAKIIKDLKERIAKLTEKNNEK